MGIITSPTSQAVKIQSLSEWCRAGVSHVSFPSPLCWLFWVTHKEYVCPHHLIYLEATRANVIKTLLFRGLGDSWRCHSQDRKPLPGGGPAFLSSSSSLCLADRDAQGSLPSPATPEATLSSSTYKDACEGLAPQRHVKYFHTEDLS